MGLEKIVVGANTYTTCFSGSEYAQISVGDGMERVKGIERFNVALNIRHLRLNARFPDTFLTNLAPLAQLKA